MKAENLVVLKAALSVTKGNTILKANKFYRCLPEDDGALIYGEWFDKKEYETLFETVYDRMMRQFKELELIDAKGKPISKNKFIRLADIHTYGSGRMALHIWFFRNSRELMWGFYPMQGSKCSNARECYEYFTDLVKGDMTAIDNGDVCFGNRGIPIKYGKLSID